MRYGRFLCSVFVASEAPIHGQLVIVWTRWSLWRVRTNPPWA